MRPRLAALLLLAGTAVARGEGPAPAFAPLLPEGVGDVTGWEVVTGEFETRVARGAYRFYVNPARAAMYQLMRYRVELLDPAGAPRRTDAERVVFVRRPGVREPIACWEKQPEGASAAWREVAAGTDEYRVEMGVLMQVLAVHRAARAGQTAP